MVFREDEQTNAHVESFGRWHPFQVSSDCTTCLRISGQPKLGFKAHPTTHIAPGNVGRPTEMAGAIEGFPSRLHVHAMPNGFRFFLTVRIEICAAATYPSEHTTIEPNGKI